MRGLSLFVAGVVVGIFMMLPGAAQQNNDTGVKLNHFGISVKNFDETMNFYTKTMGFHEAFTIRNKDGKPTLSYIQISRDTFLEIAQAGPDRQPGVTHIGLQAADLNATIARLRQAGLKIDDPRTGATHAPLANLNDVDGLRLELVEFTPDSLQKKAVDAWK